MEEAGITESAQVKEMVTNYTLIANEQKRNGIFPSLAHLQDLGKVTETSDKGLPSGSVGSTSRGTTCPQIVMNKNNGHEDSTDKVMTTEPRKEELRRDCECRRENSPNCEGAFTSTLVVGLGGPMASERPSSHGSRRRAGTVVSPSSSPLPNRLP